MLLSSPLPPSNLTTPTSTKTPLRKRDDPNRKRRTRLRCNRGGCSYRAPDKADLEYDFLSPL
jgi:hypothetical protein